jgi:hypothetical protein
MKPKLILFTMGCVVASLVALAQDLTTALQKEAQNYAKGLMANDGARVLDLTLDRVVAKMGGKQTALNLLQKSTAEMKTKGLVLEDAKVGAPLPPQKIGTWTVSVIPETLTLRTPTAKAQQESHLLGISADEGKTWKFMDLGPITEEQLFGLYPELKGQFTMPAKKQAMVEKKP